MLRITPDLRRIIPRSTAQRVAEDDEEPDDVTDLPLPGDQPEQGPPLPEPDLAGGPVLVAKGNPKKITGINMSLCGAAAAENTGYVEVPLVQDLAPKCKAEGKPEPTIQLYDNNANCIQAILAGRADTYVNDVNTVDQAVKANPDKLEKAIAVTIPYSVGIAVPKDKPEFRDAVMAALIEIQKAGIHKDLLKKWDLDPNNFKEPDILSVK